jgi:thiol-disulfide isomerase/thioredoxin
MFWKLWAGRFVITSFALCGLLLAIGAGCNSQPDQSTSANQFRVKEDDSNDESATSGKEANSSPTDDETEPARKPNLPALAADEGAEPGVQVNPEEASEPGDASPAPRSASKTGKANDPALAGPTSDKVKLLRKLSTTEPAGRTQQQKIQNLERQMEELLVTAQEILAEPKAPAEAKEEALRARLGVATVFFSLKPGKETRASLVSAAEDLAAVDNPRLATIGKTQLFTLKVDEILALKPDDGQAVVESIEALLKEDGEVPMLLQAAVGAATQLEQAGYEQDAIAALTMIGKHFADSKDEQVALVGKQLQLSALLGKIRISEGDEAAKAGDDLLAKAREVAEASGGDASFFSIMSEMAMSVEATASADLALRVYELMEETYGEHANEKVAEAAKSSVANARKRLALIGKPFSVEGVLLGDKPFDWEKYKGKIVLVDFWATWCGPCLQEFPNIIKNYKQYHEQGFEVVGVNLDDDVETVQEFFEAQELPWPTVVSANDDARGFSHPTAEKSGVDSIPFVVLVGRDGKVAGIHVRGPKLAKALEEMLADTETPPAEEATKEASRTSSGNPLR